MFVLRKEMSVPALRIDWRWIALFVIIIVLANARSLPWPITALALALPGSWLIYHAAQMLGLAIPGTRPTTRVTYWRGRRIETNTPVRRNPFWDRTNLVPGLLYGITGLMLTLAALAVVTRNLGM
jgi:hypothetical protein